MNGRWADYFMRSGEAFHQFWEEYLRSADRSLLVILGQGFDPRMCEGVRILTGFETSHGLDCVLLEYDEGPRSSSLQYKPQIATNCRLLEELIESKHGTIKRREIRVWSDDHRRVISRSAGAAFQSAKEFTDYTDVIVDISALPRSIYFPLIHKILLMLDADRSRQSVPNLHVVVAEDAHLDSKIRDTELEEDASYIHGFGGLDLESTKDMPKIWIPLIGEGQQEQLSMVFSLVNPNEVCPLFPFPSKNTRRGDDLLREHHRFLFDQLGIEPGNIIYADEQNPFQVYRQIRTTIQHYQETLKIIGGCKVIISALSSKLLSIGALLAAYEAKADDAALGPLVGIADVEPLGYLITEEVVPNSELYELWIAGECYG